MQAAVDWEQVFQAEILAQKRTANRILSAQDKFNYVLTWEKEDVLPQLKQLYYAAVEALSNLDQTARRKNILLVETELLVRDFQKPADFFQRSYSEPDYVVVLPKDVMDLHPVLDQTFPVSQVLDEKDGWTGEARIIHPILMRSLATLIERDNHVVKAVHPRENGNGLTDGAAALSRLTLQ
jgi:hypothetical protein